MAKIGFSGQWVEICKVGKATDSNGVNRNLDADFINQVITNYNASDEHEAPAVIGHPEDNSPSYGWVSELRLNNDILEAKFADVPDEFEDAVRSGLYRKRSASFYLDKPNLRHVGFLGAQPPAIKGLKNIQFSDGESITVEISFNEEQKIMSKENENSDEKKTFKEWMKEFFGGGQQPMPTTSFSEADQQKLIDAAVEKATQAATAQFTEELGKRDTQIKTLTDVVNAGSVKGKRAEIAAFCESIPAEKGKHFLKRSGLAEFLESLVAADDKDEAKAISFSEGDGDTKVEHKFSRYEWAKQLINDLPPMIQFGESFGNLKVTAEAGALVDPERQTIIDNAVNGGGAE